jgi:predicted  nucleic acid-binding Zn-ribbon protein
MKEQKPGTSKTAATQPKSPASTLQNNLKKAAKNLEKAWEAYEKKAASYEEADKQEKDKMGIKRLLSAAKIAKFTYKIKVVEHKLAKAILKAANKADKKSGKETAKFKAIITTEDQLNSNAEYSKNDVQEIKAKAAPKGKKKTEVKD